MSDTADGTLSGKGLAYGGSETRTEAAGYSLAYIVSEALAEVGKPLKAIMHNICTEISHAAKDYNVPGNFVTGANIAGFRKVIKAMREEGAL